MNIAIAVAQRNRVGHHHLLERRRGQPVVGGAGEHGVGTRRIHPRGAPVDHRLPGRGKRARRVDDVVEDDRVLAPHVADHIPDLGHLLGGALLGHDRQVGPDHLGELVVELHTPDVR